MGTEQTHPALAFAIRMTNGAVAEKRSRPFAGMTRIRFEGFGRQAISAPEKEHPSDKANIAGCGAGRKTYRRAGRRMPAGVLAGGYPADQAAIAFSKTRSPGVPFSKVRMARWPVS